MQLSNGALRAAISKLSPEYPHCGQLKEIISTSELPEDVCVEWLLDHSRSNDGAQP